MNTGINPKAQGKIKPKMQFSSAPTEPQSLKSWSRGVNMLTLEAQCHLHVSHLPT